MPRPPKKKVRKSYGKDDDYQLNNGKEPSVQQTESSDDLKNLANIIKLKRSSKVGNQSFENFEKKCYKLLESATGQIESKIEAHEENLARLYRSVEEINEEVEPTQNEVILERIISKCFDPEVTYLSRVLTDMNSGKNCDSDELQINLTELMEELNMRPEQLAEFSRRMTSECKRAFRMYCENNKVSTLKYVLN
ncbi:hypothetical protein Pst134EA_017252 [Puccinia striiformis f. sp. tritici]|uniref:hypothetical protein n=1 Tax=Puccinia striiformis f. sp. tritici TaxID=168172 RepID=UPI0020078B8B|nr:hypothetical protein Pst134EA_017252 [Puccinia striiformis f. sp. tritici]KAH9460943.1 hypothetical protein Pst134EA_017252 [Puccinia striiformis f. sp. tritici]